MALGSKKGDRELTIPHKGNIQSKIKNARNMLNIADSKFDLYMHQAQQLANTRIDRPTFNDYLETLYPDPETKDGEKKKNKRSQNIRNEIRDVAENETNKLATAQGTYWGAVNAVTEYIDHNMKIRKEDEQPDRRMKSLVLEHGARQKQKALDLACEMAGVEVESDN